MLSLHRTHRNRVGLLPVGALMALPILSVLPSKAQEQAAPPKGAAVTAPLALTVKTDQAAYKPDSTIKLTLTAKNTSQQEVLVRFNNGQRYDFELYRGKNAKGEKLWQWSKGMFFNMMVSATKVQPGKSLEYTQTYRSGGGMPVLPPGTYTMVATLKGVLKTATPTAPLTASVTFKVN